MPDCPMRSNTKKQPSIQCRVCGTISISKIENNFLSTNPTTLILSTLVSEFRQRILIWEKNLAGGGGGGGGCECGREWCQQSRLVGIPHI